MAQPEEEEIFPGSASLAHQTTADSNGNGITKFLEHALSVDANKRKEAEDGLKDLKRAGQPAFLLMLASELANGKKPIEASTLAGRMLTYELVDNWIHLNFLVEFGIKSFLFKTLRSVPKKFLDESFVPPFRVAAQAIARIAFFELLQEKSAEISIALMKMLSGPRKHKRRGEMAGIVLGYFVEDFCGVDVPVSALRHFYTVIFLAIRRNYKHSLVLTRALYKAFPVLCEPVLQLYEPDLQLELLHNLRQTTMVKEFQLRQASQMCFCELISDWCPDHELCLEGECNCSQKLIVLRDVLHCYACELFQLTISVQYDKGLILQAFKSFQEICDYLEEKQISAIFALTHDGRDFKHEILSRLVPQIPEKLPNCGAYNCLRLLEPIGRNVLPEFVIPFFYRKYFET